MKKTIIIPIAFIFPLIAGILTYRFVYEIGRASVLLELKTVEECVKETTYYQNGGFVEKYYSVVFTDDCNREVGEKIKELLN